MKFRVIQGQKEQKQQPAPMEDYYGKDRPRAQDMEKAEGDEDIVDEALNRDEKKNRKQPQQPEQTKKNAA